MRLVIARGHVLEEGEGWLRVGPVPGKYTPIPVEDFVGEFQRVPLTVDSANEDWEERFPDYYDNSEVPLRFKGSSIVDGLHVAVEGIHFRSGRLRGILNLSAVEVVQDQSDQA